MNIFSIVGTLDENLPWIVSSHNSFKISFDKCLRLNEIASKLVSLNKKDDEKEVKEIIKACKELDENFFINDEGTFPVYTTCSSELED